MRLIRHAPGFASAGASTQRPQGLRARQALDMRSTRPARGFAAAIAIVAALVVSGAMRSAAPAAAQGGSPDSGAVVIRDVTVISATGAPPIEHAAVVIDGERISYVGPLAGAPAPDAARTIDGAGKFLIPGLIEMHAHVSKTRASSLGLFVANGITTLRDMGGDREELTRWRAEIRSKRRIGPSMLVAGPYLESARNVTRMLRTPAAEMAEPVERTRVAVGSPADAERVVASLAGHVDHIKIRTVQNRDTYLAIGRAARKYKLPLVGHVYGIAPEDILLSGQRSIEHQLYPTLDNLSVEQRLALFKRFAAAGVGIVPTFVTITRSIFPSSEELQAIVDDENGAREPRRRYISKYLLIDWREQIAEQNDDRRAQFKPIYESSVRNVREMRQAGMRIMAGSDVAVLNVFPGSSLHEEMNIFVKTIGMTPMEALQSATMKSAEFLGLGSSIGTVETGKIADLVLLDANPLDDITNVGRINAVILRGRLFDRAGLDQLLASVEAAPDRRVNDWPRRSSAR
jgi:imidazolonepropionase-like amidohydrolase